MGRAVSVVVMLLLLGPAVMANPGEVIPAPPALLLAALGVGAVALARRKFAK